MDDCKATKPGMEPCLRKKGHPGKHTSFAEDSKGWDFPIHWDLESIESDRNVPVPTYKDA